MLPVTYGPNPLLIALLLLEIGTAYAPKDGITATIFHHLAANAERRAQSPGHRHSPHGLRLLERARFDKKWA
jgi:hypothetical protein